jgi:hypothetical protein
MKILKPINWVYNIRTGIIKTFIQGGNDVAKMKLRKLQNDIESIEAKDSIIDLEVHMKYKKTLRKTKLISFFIIFGFITSICLTLAGTEKIDFFDANSLNTANITYCSIIFFLQSIVFIVTSKESTIKAKYYNHYWGFKFAQYFIVASSIYYNFRFFMMYFTDMNYLELTITAFICAGLDLVTIKLIGLKNDMKNNVMSVMKQKEPSLQNSLHYKKPSLQNSLHYIKEKCDENNSLHYKEPSLQTDYIKPSKPQKNKGCNEKNEGVMKQKIHNTLQKKQCNEPSLQTEKCNEESVMNSLQNEKCNEENVMNQKNVMDQDLVELAKKIDEYITIKYRIDDLISVKEIKEKFNISQQRKWAKIISLLQSAAIINGRLRRIQTHKKDNIKRVK